MKKIPIEKKNDSSVNILAVLVVTIVALVALFIWLSPSNSIDPPIQPTSSITNQYDIVTPNWSEVKEIFEGYDKDITSHIPEFNSKSDPTFSVKDTSTEGEDGWSVSTKLENSDEEDVKNYEDELKKDFEETHDHEYYNPIFDLPYDLYVIIETEQEVPYVVTITYICVPKDTPTSWPFSTLVRNFGYAKARAIPMVTIADIYEVTSESKEEVIIELSTDKPSTIYYKYVDDLTERSYTLNNQTYVKSTSGLSFDLAHNIGVTIDIKSVPTWVETPTIPDGPTDTDEEPTIPDGPTNPDEPTIPENPTNPDTPDTPDTPTTPDTPATPDRVSWSTVIGTLDKYTERSLPSIVPEYIGNGETTTFSSRTITDSNFISAYKYGIVATNTTEVEASTYIDTLITRGYSLEKDTNSYKIVTEDGYYTIHIEVRYTTNQTNINIYGTQNPRVAWGDANIEALKETSSHEDIDSIIEPYMSVKGEYTVKSTLVTEDGDWYVTIEVTKTDEEELDDWLATLTSFEKDEEEGRKLSNVTKYTYDDLSIVVSYKDDVKTATIYFAGIRTVFYWDDIIIEIGDKITNLKISEIPHLDDTIKLYDYQLTEGTNSILDYQRISVTGIKKDDISTYITLLETAGYEYYDNYWINEDGIGISISLPADGGITTIQIGIVFSNPIGIEGTYFYTTGDGIKKVVYGSDSFTVYTYNIGGSQTIDYTRDYSITAGKVNGPDDIELKILPYGNLGNRLFKVKPGSEPHKVNGKYAVYPLIDGNLAISFDTATVNSVPSELENMKVTTIMANAFKGKTLNTKIIPSSITTIGVSAFEDVELSNLIVKRSIKYIGAYAFKNTNLNSLEFEDLSNVKYIDDEAFSYNEIVDEPNLDVVPFVGVDVYLRFGDIEGTFYRYEHQSGGSYLHRYVFDLETKTFTWDRRPISNKGTWDGEWRANIYINRTYIPGKNITLKFTYNTSNYVESRPIVDNANIGDEFYKTTEEPKIEDGVIYLDTISRGVSIGFTKKRVGNVIPTEYNGKKVEAIQRYGISDPEYSNATIRIPRSVKYIGMKALNSGYITGITFEEGSELEEIEQYALDASSVSGIVIPNTVKKIGTRALRGLGTVTFAPNSIIETLEPELFGNGLHQITIPKSVKTFDGAFSLPYMQTINIEEGSPYFKVEDYLVKSIDGKEVWFGNSNSNTTISIPSGVEIVHKSAFYSNGGQKTALSLPNTLKIIEEDAFRENKFTSITIPASVTRIDKYAFFVPPLQVVKITNLTFAANSKIESIGLNAFGGANISSVTLPKSLKDFNGAFELGPMNTINIDATSEYFKVQNGMVMSQDGKDVWFGSSSVGPSIVIPEGVETIHRNAFQGLQRTSLTLPSTLKVIEQEAFQDHRFTSISIPTAVDFIGRAAFYNTEANSTLSSITFGATRSTTIIEYTAFGNAYKGNIAARPDLSWVASNPDKTGPYWN